MKLHEWAARHEPSFRTRILLVVFFAFAYAAPLLLAAFVIGRVFI